MDGQEDVWHWAGRRAGGQMNRNSRNSVQMLIAMTHQNWLVIIIVEWSANCRDLTVATICQAFLR